MCTGQSSTLPSGFRFWGSVGGARRGRGRGGSDTLHTQEEGRKEYEAILNCRGNIHKEIWVEKKDGSSGGGEAWKEEMK